MVWFGLQEKSCIVRKFCKIPLYKSIYNDFDNKL